LLLLKWRHVSTPLIGSSSGPIHEYENLRSKLYNRNANIYFNRQCLQKKLILNYVFTTWWWPNNMGRNMSSHQIITNSKYQKILSVFWLILNLFLTHIILNTSGLTHLKIIKLNQACFYTSGPVLPNAVSHNYTTRTTFKRCESIKEKLPSCHILKKYNYLEWRQEYSTTFLHSAELEDSQRTCRTSSPRIAALTKDRSVVPLYP